MDRLRDCDGCDGVVRVEGKKTMKKPKCKVCKLNHRTKACPYTDPPPSKRTKTRAVACLFIFPI